MLIDTKFNVGDKLFCILGYKTALATIEKITIFEHDIFYSYCIQNSSYSINEKKINPEYEEYHNNSNKIFVFSDIEKLKAIVIKSIEAQHENIKSNVINFSEEKHE